MKQNHFCHDFEELRPSKVKQNHFCRGFEEDRSSKINQIILITNSKVEQIAICSIRTYDKAAWFIDACISWSAFVCIQCTFISVFASWFFVKCYLNKTVTFYYYVIASLFQDAIVNLLLSGGYYS